MYTAPLSVLCAHFLEAQLAGRDLPPHLVPGAAAAAPLVSNISTDEITPGWVCYYYDETLGRYCLVGLRGHGFQIFGFEDLPAVEALHVVHAVSTGEDDCFLMLAGGLHNERLGQELL